MTRRWFSGEENNYRVYGENEIKILKVIKVLRTEKYCTKCIASILEELKKVINRLNSVLYESNSDLNNWMKSPLSEAELDVKEVIDCINELIIRTTYMEVTYEE